MSTFEDVNLSLIRIGQGSKLTPARLPVGPRSTDIASSKLFSFFTCPSDRRSFLLLFHVKSTPTRCLRSSLARQTGAITVSGKFC